MEKLESLNLNSFVFDMKCSHIKVNKCIKFSIKNKWIRNPGARPNRNIL